MGLLFRNWLEEGFYEEDDYGLTKIETEEEIYQARKDGILYYSNGDGYGPSKINEDIEE